MAAEAGLDPHLTIMFGYPWETRDEAMRTVETAKWLIKKGYAKTWQVTIVIPYPRTPLYDMANKNGWLRTEDWERYDMREPILKTPMGEKEVLEITQGLYKVAFDPEFIARRILAVRSIIGHVKDFSPSQNN